ncbi:hypothetical protein ACYCUO_14665 [Paenibacillus sp. SEL2]
MPSSQAFDEVNALHASVLAYPRSGGHFMPSIPFLKWGDFMDPAVSSGAVHLNLKKR